MESEKQDGVATEVATEVSTAHRVPLCECLHARNMHRSECCVDLCSCDGFRPNSFRLRSDCPRCLAYGVLMELAGSGYESTSRIVEQIEALVRHQRLSLCAHHLSSEV